MNFKRCSEIAVSKVVLTTQIFIFSLSIGYLIAKSLQSEEPNLRSLLRKLSRLFAFYPLQTVHLSSISNSLATPGRRQAQSTGRFIAEHRTDRVGQR
ncbi:hypothetical protein [Raoultella terrigena]|uniref:hypothetical protein n=1 Tax=Raoultella terrigena TaxID=577 RepID=UPI0038911FC8